MTSARPSIAVATGVAGLSIEDSTGETSQPLYELGEAVERMRAARRAIDDAGGEVLLSVGGSLARCAWGGFMRAARQIAEQGRFDGLVSGAPGAELNTLFGG